MYRHRKLIITVCLWCCMLLPYDSAMAALIAHYTLDEGSGQAISDSSGNGLDGILGNNTGAEAEDPAWLTSGLAPVSSGTTAALEFDGTNDYARVSDSSVLNLNEPGDQGTIAFWFNAHTVDFMHGVTKRGEYALRFFVDPDDGDLVMRFDMWGDNSGSSGPGISLNTWHHAAVSFTAGVGGTLYLDGGEYKTYTTSDTSSDDNHPLFIGALNGIDGIQGHYDGSLDEIRIYDEALNQSTIQALAAPASVPIPGSLGLLLSACASLLYVGRRPKTH